MRRHAVIPVMYDDLGECSLRATTPPDSLVRFLRGDEFADQKFQFGACVLQDCLDAGWSIISVQTSTLRDKDDGRAVFVYILESPEIE